MGFFHPDPTPAAKAEFERETRRLNRERGEFVSGLMMHTALTAKVDRFPRTMARLHHALLWLSLATVMTVQFSPNADFLHVLSLLGALLIAWLLLRMTRLPFFRRRARWASRNRLMALAMLAPSVTVLLCYWTNPFDMLRFLFGRAVGISFRGGIPDLPFEAFDDITLCGVPSGAYVVWALAAYGLWYLSVVLGRKVFLASEVEQARLAGLANDKNDELDVLQCQWENKYGVDINWGKIALTIGMVVIGREIAGEIFGDMFGGEEALTFESGDYVPTGEEWAAFPVSDALVDLDGDGLADMTSWGTPVSWIDAYMRDGSMVAGHYRTIADGVLWNNLGSG